MLQGSHIATEDDDTIPTVLKEQRRKRQVLLMEFFKKMFCFRVHHMYVAMFVIGKSANGLTSWKDEDGCSLKEIENSETAD